MNSVKSCAASIRFIRLRDAPAYLGMDKNRFNREVRPHVTVIPIGTQGVAFDRLDLDAWADDHKRRNGRPAAHSERIKPWETENHQASSSVAGSGTSTKCSEAHAFARALQRASLPTALEYFAKRIDQIRSASVYGLRTDRTFRAAATRFLEENQHKRSIADDAMLLKQLDPYIGELKLRQVHMGSLQSFIAKRRTDGVKSRTINNALALTRHILNLAACEWRDEQGLTWLQYAAKIKLLKVTDGRPPYPLSREEQAVFFRELPDHLARMALFKVNTGCREQEVCGLRWDHEVRVPELGTSVFIIPGNRVKNGEDRLVVLNRMARSVIDAQRRIDPQYVFTYCRRPRKAAPGEPQAAPARKPLATMITKAWSRARSRAADKWDEDDRRSGACGLQDRARARPEAHLWTEASGGRGVVRGSAGLARPQEHADHDTLLGGRARESDCRI